jgi:hypothetical protein
MLSLGIGVELVLHYASGRCGWTKVGLYLWHKLALNPTLCGTVALMVTQIQKTIRATIDSIKNKCFILPLPLLSIVTVSHISLKWNIIYFELFSYFIEHYLLKQFSGKKISSVHVTCRPENWRCQQLMQIQQKNNPFYLQPTSSLNYFSRSSHNNFIFIDIIHKTYNKKKYQHYVTTNHEYASYYIMNKMAADMNIHNNKSTLNPYRWIVLNLIITTCICFNVVCFFL